MSTSTPTVRPSREPGSCAAELVNSYLDAFYLGDFDRASVVVADGFTFQGPFLKVEGKDAFFSGAQGLRGIVRGHRLLRQWVDGNDVSSLYEAELATPAGKGSVIMSEWHQVADRQLVSGRVIFDTNAFRALLPASPNVAASD